MNLLLLLWLPLAVICLARSRLRGWWFAWLLHSLRSPQSPVGFPGSDIVFESDSVSASAVRFQLGARYGCLTAILDMLKVAIPTLIVRLWQPDEAYYLVLAGAGVAGHAWPVYFRFKGGRGESPILGGCW